MSGPRSDRDPQVRDLRRHLEQYDLLFNAIEKPMALLSVETGRTFCLRKLNHAFLQLHHLASADWQDRAISEVLGPPADLLFDHCLGVIDAQKPLTFEQTHQSATGGAVFETTLTPVFGTDGTCTYVLFAASDVTARKQSDAVMHHLAFYDALTGLPNRSGFEEALEELLSQRPEARRLAVLALGVDNFKRINDSLGHAIGDRLLRELAHRISARLRDHDRIARLGGDEFVLLLGDCGGLEEVEAIAQRLHETLSAPFSIDGYELFARASIGISRFPEDGNHAGELIKHADAALYRAKQEQLGLKVFAPAINSNENERLTLEGQLRKALERSEFVLHYQPQVHLETGRIMGAEALVRWHHPEHGMVSPATFIPLAEETGLILPLTEWVLETAAREQVRWVTTGLGRLRISVNLSGRHFKQYDLVGLIRRTLAATNLDPEYLELELTEGILIDNVDTTLDTMRQLTELGVTFSIDDFGTGYSSLGYLKRFPTHTLKIDQSFVRKLRHDSEDAAITAAIIALARALKLKTVAEGVETTEQLAILKAQGCDGIQGYLFSRPLADEAFRDLVRTQRQIVLDPAAS